MQGSGRKKGTPLAGCVWEPSRCAVAAFWLRCESAAREGVLWPRTFSDCVAVALRAAFWQRRPKAAFCVSKVCVSDACVRRFLRFGLCVAETRVLRFAFRATKPNGPRILVVPDRVIGERISRSAAIGSQKLVVAIGACDCDRVRDRDCDRARVLSTACDRGGLCLRTARARTDLAHRGIRAYSSYAVRLG